MGHTFLILFLFLVWLVNFFVENWTFIYNDMITLEIMFSPFSGVCCFLVLFCFVLILGCLHVEDQPEV